MRIAIAGATGAVGRFVGDVARERGHTPVEISRSAGIDLLDPVSVARAVVGADSIVDVSSVVTTSAQTSRHFFRTATTNLLAAGDATGIRNHVVLSIVNVDKAPSGYYAGKVLQENIVAGSTVPWSILRATQFHEFAAQMLDRAKLGPVRTIPIMRTQPVAAREVAERLVDVAEQDAQGRVSDLAGPREERLVTLARAYARAKGWRIPIASVPLPGGMGTAMRDGTLLPGPDAQRGSVTFDEWLRTTA
ncbi:SDR family oxidoreductase [Salinibacterium hongtaonis]|uniref:SDR family oxidoreductase n=1 Tax=Homoserinimonas hongtaonis TaxID=2079791 RepID=UPI000D3B4A35|nr:NAD(P)H-binding protein [Salinibacterium hongtaonis]AWB88429.1 3-beta hydroxysteroid dehydrogenase [Salinibacterium hongtaonis]